MEFNAVDFIKTLGVSFAALFPIVNPVGDAPIFFWPHPELSAIRSKSIGTQNRGLRVCASGCFGAFRQ